MDIEKRLRQHLTDQADGLDLETAAPESIVGRVPGSRNVVTTGLAALFVVVAAAAGFWMLSSEDKGPITEIAAGQADDVNTDDEGRATDQRAGADHFDLEIVDITSENSPGNGRVRSDGGIYYVLSSAPGRVDLSESLTEEQYLELVRQNSFYVFDQDAGWSVNEVEDRFISDFDVSDGVLYVVSTGSKTGAAAAFGTSTDRGKSWTWNEIDGVPEVDQMAMLRRGDQTVIFASRSGYPDHGEVLAAAKGAGLPVDGFNLRDFDINGFSYVEIDPADRCAAVEAQFLPEVEEFSRWSQEAPEEQTNEVESEYQSMLGYVREEIEAAGCPWNEGWETAGTANGFEFPDPVRVTWDDLGFTPPESWKTWSTTYRSDAQGFTDVGKPFDDKLQPGGANSADGRLIVSVWDPTAQVEAEILWSTTDGLNWAREIRRYDQSEEGPYYDAFTPEPIAGEHTFRLWWDESAYIQYEEGLESAEGLAVDVAGDGLGAEAIEEAVRDEAGFVEPEAMLQLRRRGGAWETVNLAEVAPNVDVGDRVLQDVRGTSLGVFVVYGEQYTPSGPPDLGLTVIYSNNGIDWGSFELEGNGIDTSGVSNGSGDEMLLFANTWPYEPGQRSSTQTLLVRPAG